MTILIVAIGVQVRAYWQRVTAGLVPTLVAYLEKSLDRSIRYDRWTQKRPGLIVLEGLHVTHDRSKGAREFVGVQRVEVQFDPGLLHWSTAWTRGLGRNTTAQINAVGLRIFQPDGERFLDAPQADTQLDLQPILSGKGDVLGTLALVNVSRPLLRVRRSADGRWNYQDLLRKKKDAKPLTFRGRILAREAQVDLFDALAGQLPGIQQTRFAGTVDAGLAAYPSVYFRVTGTLSDGGVERFPVRPVTASGHTDTRIGALFVRVAGVSHNIQHWLRYATRSRLPLQIDSGRARYDLVAWTREKKAPPQFRLTANVERGRLRAPEFPLPVENIVGKLTADPQVVTFDLDGRVQGSKVHGAGEVALKPEPVVRARLSSPDLTSEWLRAAVPSLRFPPELRLPRTIGATASLTGFRGRYSFRGRASTDVVVFQQDRAARVTSAFRGTFQSGGALYLDGTVQAQEGTARGVLLQSGHIDFRLRPELLQVTGEVAAVGGKVAVKGWVDLAAEPMEFFVRGTGTGLQPTLMPGKSEDLRVSGAISTEFSASGAFSDPHISAYVEAAPLSVEGYTLDRASARIDLRNGVVQVSYGVAERQGQQVGVSGRVSQKGELDLLLIGQGLDAGRLGGELVEEPIEGTVYLSAQISGTTEQPVVASRVQLYHPRLTSRKDMDADYASANVEWTARGPVILHNVSVIRTPLRAEAARLMLTPPAEGEQEWSIEADGAVEGLSVIQALRLGGMTEDAMRKSPVSGAFDALKFSARGQLNRMQIGLEARGSAFAIQGLDLGNVTFRGSVDLGSQVARLDAVTATSSAQRIEASGEVRFSKSFATTEGPPDPLGLSLRVGVEDLRLPPMIRRFAPQTLDAITIDGSLRRADLQISGTTEHPEVQGQIALTGLVINERAIRIDPVLIQANQRVIVVREVEARLGSGTLRVPYLAALLQPDGSSRQLLERMIGQVIFDEVPVSVIEQLVEDSPLYQGKSFDGLREALNQWTTPVAGKVSATLTAASSNEPPPASLPAVVEAIRSRRSDAVVVGEIQVPDLASPPDSDGPLTRVAGRFRYVPGRLDVTEIRLEQEPDTRLTLSGFLVEAGKQGDGEVSINARGEGLKLTSLARLPIRGLAERLEPLQPLEGVGRFTAVASGTVRHPQLKTNLEIDRPVVAGVPFDSLLVEGGEYSAREGMLRLATARLTKRLPDGEPESSLRIQGRLPVTWPKLSIPDDLPRELTVQIPEQSLAVFKVLAEDAERQAKERGGEHPGRLAPLIAAFQQIAATAGRMDGSITLGGTRKAPANTGFFRLENATLRVEGLETEIRKIHARVDLEGDELQVTRLDGESSRSGTLRGEGTVFFGITPNGDFDPRLDLRLRVDRFKFVEKKVGSLLGEAFKGTQTNGILQSVNSGATAQPAPIRITGYLKNPLIEGGIRLDESSTLLAFDPAVPRKEPGEGGGPRIQLRLAAGNNVWLRNPQARLKLGGGVTVANTVSAPVVTGDLLVQEGTIPLPGIRLRNVEGVLRINYDGRARELKPEGRSPVFVDLTAESSLRLQRSAALEAEDYDLQLAIRGSPGGTGESGIRPAGVTGGLLLGGDSGLAITVRTDPPLPAGEIEALIRQHFGVEGFGGGGSNVVEALRSQIEQALAVNVSSALTGRIEDVLQSALGLNVFSIDLGVSQPLRIRLGRRLFGKLYGTVSQQFGSAVGNDTTRYEIYYRLTPRLRLGYRQEEPLGLRVIFVSGGVSF